MSEIKRLEMDHKGLPFVDDNGVYVLYEDYAELKAQRDALAAENDSLMKFCKNAAFDADYESELGMERGGFTDAINDIKTPATDAYLNSVRAEGVKILADRMQQTIDNAKLNSDEIGALAGAIFTGAAIADQLRAGEPS
ncbi:hypothetical protein [uncultured Pantoea sp.]|uniref:hypothetical protein n=1 Tax=uncultured Pantoea sp. TaxID=218084 RepID=UPI0025E59ECF|nr:hypothetical protein [uncultured Pantoea sp.]